MPKSDKHKKPYRAFKESKVKPTRKISSNIKELLPQFMWYVWKYDWNGKKWSKYPRSPRNEFHTFSWSKKENLKEWGTFLEALTALQNNSSYLQGIGIAVEAHREFRVGSKECYIVFIEIDDCFDFATWTITLPWVEALVDRLNTYTEVSPSGKGLHLVATGERPPSSPTLLPKEIRGGVDAQVYGGNLGKNPVVNKNITFTGRVFLDRSIKSVQDWLEELPRKKSVSGTRDSKTDQNTVGLRDLEEARQAAIERIYARDSNAEEKLRIARQSNLDEIPNTVRALPGDTFSRLWEGRWKDGRYDTQSDADQALCLRLASGTGLDLEKMNTLFRRSGLYRDKWDREEYRIPTLHAAFSKCDRVYIPPNHYRKYKTSTDAPLPKRTDVPRKEVKLPDDQILEVLRNSKGEWGAKFPKLWEGDPSLWEGDNSAYKNIEAAQLALCARLAPMTGNDEEWIDRLFRRSGLYADNWEEDSHRNQTIRKSLQNWVYGPDTGERDRILDELSELRLNLAWNKGYWHACYIYDALIAIGYKSGKTDLGRGLELDRETMNNALFDYFIDEPPHVVVCTDDRDLQLQSNISSKGEVGNAIRILENECLIKILRREKRSPFSIYVLINRSRLPKSIIPYPPGFVGTQEDARAFYKVIEKDILEENGGWDGKTPHPLRMYDFKKKMERVPTKPFRSPLNSKATHDRNIKNLLLEHRLEEGHPEGTLTCYKNKKSELVRYAIPDPPSFLSPPYDKSICHLSPEDYLPQLSSEKNMSLETRREKLPYVSITLKQKFLLEQIDHWRCTLLELMKFFGENRKDNFSKNTINPLVEKGLLESFSDPEVGECYKKTVDFEETIDQRYEELRGREKYEGLREKAEEDRKKYKDMKENRLSKEEWFGDKVREEEEERMRQLELNRQERAQRRKLKEESR